MFGREPVTRRFSERITRTCASDGTPSASSTATAFVVGDFRRGFDASPTTRTVGRSSWLRAPGASTPTRHSQWFDGVRWDGFREARQQSPTAAFSRSHRQCWNEPYHEGLNRSAVSRQFQLVQAQPGPTHGGYWRPPSIFLHPSSFGPTDCFARHSPSNRLR